MDIGDIIYTIDGESVKGVDVPTLVSKIVGLPGSRITLELLRPREMAGILPSPVMIGPFKKLDLSIKRLANQTNPTGSAGLGILFHKVCWCVNRLTRMSDFDIAGKCKLRKDRGLPYHCSSIEHERGSVRQR